MTQNGVGAGETLPTSASSCGRRWSPEKGAGQEEGEEEEEEETESPPPLPTPVIEGVGGRGNQEEEEEEEGKGEEEGEEKENRRYEGGQQEEESVDAPVNFKTEGEGGAVRPRSAAISYTEGKQHDPVSDHKGTGSPSSSGRADSKRSSSNSSGGEGGVGKGGVGEGGVGEGGVGEVDRETKECSQHPPSSSHSDYHTPSPIPEEDMQRLSLAGAAEGGREKWGGGGEEAAAIVVKGQGVDEEEEELLHAEGTRESHRSSSERSAVSRPRAPRPGFSENGYAEGASTGSCVNSMEDGEGEGGSLVSPEGPPSAVVPTNFGNALHAFGGEERTHVKPTARHTGE